MRAASILLGFILLAASTLSAGAETFKTPQALIKALYAYNIDATSGDAPTPYMPFFTKGLIALFQADRDRTPEGEIGAIDFDPVISGQDGSATKLKIGTPVVTGDTAKLEVNFRNGGPVTLHYTVKQEGGGWKVDDIANRQGEYPWSLRDLLKSP